VKRLPAFLLAIAALVSACDGERSNASALPVVKLAGVELEPDWVVDHAELLSPETERALAGRLQELEAKTSDQLVVVTLPGLGNEPIEKVGAELGNSWGIGQSGKDNGALLIVAPAERKVRIATGLGMAERLSDARAQQIIDTDILPHMRTGAHERGILAGADAIIATLLRSAAVKPGRIAA
jgi:uncharacterized protein